MSICAVLLSRSSNEVQNAEFQVSGMCLISAHRLLERLVQMLHSHVLSELYAVSTHMSKISQSLVFSFVTAAP